MTTVDLASQIFYCVLYVYNSTLCLCISKLHCYGAKHLQNWLKVITRGPIEMTGENYILKFASLAIRSLGKQQ